MSGLLQDFRYAVRLLLRSPVYTAAAVVSLALGVGANTTIFSLLNGVFLHPLPVADPGSLVSVFTTDARNTGGFNDYLPTSHPNFEDYRDQNRVFSGLAAYQNLAVSVAERGDAEQVAAEMVSAGYFQLLGLAPRIGRFFTADEEREGQAGAVAVLGHGYWVRRFGADRGVVGRTITLNRQPFTIVGVAPEGFKGANAFAPPAVWVPLALHKRLLSGFFAENYDSRRALLFNVVGRLRPGVSLDQATAQMKTLAAALEREYPEPNKGRSVVLVPLAQATINPGIRRNAVLGGAMLMAIVAVVLLIACANVANLLLARAATREKEIAVRLSLGAPRPRLVRQLLTESLVLAGAGGAAGLVFALWGRSLLSAARPPFLPPEAFDLAFDARVLAFTIGVSLATGVAFGLVPALQASHPDLAVALKDRSSLPTGSARWFSARNLFVAAQVALSLVSLVAGGLFIRSLGRAQRIDPGFDVGRTLMIQFDLGSEGYDEVRGRDFHRRLIERVRTLPGMQAAAVTDSVPLFGGGIARSVFPEGRDASDPRNGILVQLAAVSPGYFETMGIRRVAGRDFADSDSPSAPRVVIINEAAARRFWPGADPIGKRFLFFGEPGLNEVVGVARDSKVNFIGEPPTPLIYTPMLQTYSPAATLVARSAGGDPSSLVPALRSAIREIDRQLPLLRVASFSEVFALSLWPARMAAWLLSLFGALALVLAAIGIYGVTSYSVTQRTREIGLRIALGAPRERVLGLVFRQAMTVAGAGMAVGLAGALLVTPLIVSLLYDVNPTDPPTYGAVVALLGLTAAAACYFPAWRASRVDPLVALREE